MYLSFQKIRLNFVYFIVCNFYRRREKSASTCWSLDYMLDEFNEFSVVSHLLSNASEDEMG